MMNLRWPCEIFSAVFSSFKGFHDSAVTAWGWFMVLRDMEVKGFSLGGLVRLRT